MVLVRIAFVALAVAVAAGLWLVFRPQASAPVASRAVPAAPAAKAFDFVVQDGKRVAGPAVLRVRQGEQVTLRIESNANDELHLHGYDLKVSIKGGEPATLQFAASRSGRFGIELHKRHAELGALEVYPQ